MYGRYRVTNRVTKETQEVEAPSAQEACQRLGWLIGDCYIVKIQKWADHTLYSRVTTTHES